MEIVRTTAYAKGLKRFAKLGASKADFAEMEKAIIADPKVGEVIKGSGGLRKLRFGYAQVGKRGGGRAIYYHWDADGVLFLLAAYPKVDKSDLTADEVKLFAELVEELKKVEG